jgi:monoamine oxidase
MLAMQLKVFTGELREIRGGTGRLVEAIAADLDVRNGTAVERVESTGEGVTVHLAGSAEPLRARAAILACPADVAAKIWPDALLRAEKYHPEVVGQVTERVVMRHHPFTPIFGAGSLSRLSAARRALPAGRVDLAGDHMTAPWVEGAIRSGQQAAARVSEALGKG